MKKTLTAILFFISLDTADATMFTTYSTGEELPFDQETITAFQLASSCAQYTEEQLARIKPYSEARIPQMFESYAKGERSVIIAEDDDHHLAGVCWFKKASDTVINFSQTNASQGKSYLRFAESIFEKNPAITRLTFKLPVERVDLFTKIMGAVKFDEIPAYEDDDAAISNGIVFKYFELTRDAVIHNTEFELLVE